MKRNKDVEAAEATIRKHHGDAGVRLVRKRLKKLQERGTPGRIRTCNSLSHPGTVREH